MTEFTGNPLAEGLRIRRTPEPCAMVIFGATGDLSHRKLIPALFALTNEHFLPPAFTVLGYARRPKSDYDFRSDMIGAVRRFGRVQDASPAAVQSFVDGIYYTPGEFDNVSGFEGLARKLDALEHERGLGPNRLFYLATPPETFETIIHHLGQVGLNRNDRGWTRIIIEKPFGRDLETARHLNEAALRVFHEDQIYRIDHYLGKENVQNILIFRFANGIFEPIWNRRYIDNVQITAAETVGVGSRAGYFDKAGTLRDIVQNHMMQLLCLTAMEPPIAMSGNAVRDEKVKVLQSLRPVASNQVNKVAVRGQYGVGMIGGECVPAYRNENDIPQNSSTETYVAHQLFIDNWRWSGVPFFLRAGKRLARRITEISIEFKQAPMHLFAHAGEDSVPNMLTMTIQPDEGMALRFYSKVPGQETQIRPVLMNFRYGTSFGVEPPEAYERLLLDAMLGDSTLFTRADEVELSWRYYMPLLEYWAGAPPDTVALYEAGTWGPDAADALLAETNRRWRRL